MKVSSFLFLLLFSSYCYSFNVTANCTDGEYTCTEEGCFWGISQPSVQINLELKQIGEEFLSATLLGQARGMEVRLVVGANIPTGDAHGARLVNTYATLTQDGFTSEGYAGYDPIAGYSGTVALRKEFSCVMFHCTNMTIEH